MVKKENLINVDDFRVYWNKNYRHQYANDNFLFALANFPKADAVAVVSGYHIGDVCYYGFTEGSKSLALVEIVDLDDERGEAEVKFLKIFVDKMIGETENGLFNYLLMTGQTMNASFKYLKNITPNLEN